MIKIATVFSVFLLASSVYSAETWNIDKDHAQVMFKANHLGFSNVYGWFRSASGSFSLDEKDAAKNSISLEVDTDSLDTMIPKRDQHLKGPDFFDTKQFPKATFKSDSVKKVDDKTYEVKGKLSLHGVTNPVSMTFHRFKTGEDPWKNMRTGGEGRFNIKRSEYNMKYMLEGIPDDVEILLNIEAIKKK